MIEYITTWLADDNHMIYGLILWLMVAMIIDFVLGFTIAKFDKEIDFSSFKAKAGIIVKVAEMILVVYFIPVAVKIRCSRYYNVCNNVGWFNFIRNL